MTLPPLTADQVTAAFALGTPAMPLVPVGLGPGHRTLQLDTFDARYFVKQYDRPTDLFAWASWLGYFLGSWEIERAAFAAGLPVARPVLAPGASVPWVDVDARGTPTAVRVHEWVAGTRRVDPSSVEVAGQLGTFLGRLHRLLPQTRQWRRQPAGVADWHHAVVPTAAGSEWYATYLACIPLLEDVSARCAAAMEEPSYLVHTHRDLHAQNVLVDASGRVVVVDWDAASTQRADWDVVETALEVAGYLSGPPDRTVVETMVERYRAAGGRCGPITEASFTGLLLCALGWVRSSLCAPGLGGSPPGRAEGQAEGSAGTEVLRALAAVERVVSGAATWAGWFA